MQNVKLNYGIQVAIEDNYWNKVNYIIELPKYEWEDQIFNNKGKCSFERYKKYIKSISPFMFNDDFYKAPIEDLKTISNFMERPKGNIKRED